MMATVSPSSPSSLVSIVIVFVADGRERIQVKSTPRWAAEPYIKAFNSHTGDAGAYAELREPVRTNGGDQ
jgi:hypothetical protein